MKTTTENNNALEYTQLSEDRSDRSKRPSLLIWEGAYANVFIVMTGGAFLTGMAILLGANDFELGLLAAVPFAMQSTQLLSPYLFTDPVKSRARVTTILAISRLLWLTVIPLLLLKGVWRLNVLIGIVSISSLLTMVSTPVWLAWMAEVIPKRIRGRFFSQRNAAVAATTIASMVCGSLILDWFRWHNNEAIGFIAIMLVAALGGLLAIRAMGRISNVPRKDEAEISHRIDILAPIRDHSFRKMLSVFVVWNIAIGLSAAFFAPHMLLNLKMSFFQIGLYSSATALVAVVSSRIWGKLVDRFGSKPILTICALGISLIPIIWLFLTENSLWILIPESIYSGLLWAGFNLAAFTLPIDRSSNANRTVYLSVFATVTGLAFFIASIAGGFAAESLSDWSFILSGTTLINYHLLFIGSAVIRLLAAVIMSIFHEPAEIRLPVVIQLMGYAVLKHISIGRQVFPFMSDNSESDEEAKNKI